MSLYSMVEAMYNSGISSGITTYISDTPIPVRATWVSSIEIDLNLSSILPSEYGNLQMENMKVTFPECFVGTANSSSSNSNSKITYAYDNEFGIIRISASATIFKGSDYTTGNIFLLFLNPEYYTLEVTRANGYTVYIDCTSIDGYEDLDEYNLYYVWEYQRNNTSGFYFLNKSYDAETGLLTLESYVAGAAKDYFSSELTEATIVVQRWT